MTLTPFGADGQFNNNLISAVVNNPEAKRGFFLQLAQVMEQKGYGDWILILNIYQSGG